MQSVLVTVMSCYLVKMTSFCSQRGEGVKKGQKFAVILNVWPLWVFYYSFLVTLLFPIWLALIAFIGGQ